MSEQAFMGKAVPRTKPKRKPSNASSAATAPSPRQPETVSGKWLASAIGIVIVAALVCVWGTLCLTFWQGSWQLLYHPTAPVTKTPASAGIAFENVQFAAGQDGLPRLSGWWVPGGPESRYSAIYLHGATGNLSDTIGALARLHAAGLNVLAFDYRGYGQSEFVHPTEERWRADVESAIGYLRDTRHIPTRSLILAGSGLGANLALSAGAGHPELAGVILDEPIEAPADAIFRDPRARLVPARFLVKDRWDSSAAAAHLGIPSLWILRQRGNEKTERPAEFDQVRARTMIVWLTRSATAESDYANTVSRWIGELSETGNLR